MAWAAAPRSPGQDPEDDGQSRHPHGPGCDGGDRSADEGGGWGGGAGGGHTIMEYSIEPLTVPSLQTE